MGAPVKIKKDSTPHKFECQLNRPKTWILSSRSAVEKLTRKREVAEILSNSENLITNVNSEKQVPQKRKKTSDFRNSHLNKVSVFADLTNFVSLKILIFDF